MGPVIFLHLILGVALGLWLGDFWLWVVACQITDIDHLYVYFVRHKLHKRPLEELKEVFREEGKYGIRSKTPLMHSFLGLIIVSGIAWLFSPEAGMIMALGYLSHLILDIPDTDVKQYFYPFSHTFSGSLPIFSRVEQVVTILSLVGLLFFFI